VAQILVCRFRPRKTMANLHFLRLIRFSKIIGQTKIMENFNKTLVNILVNKAPKLKISKRILTT
jgi:hypothetical protein